MGAHRILFVNIVKRETRPSCLSSAERSRTSSSSFVFSTPTSMANRRSEPTVVCDTTGVSVSEVNTPRLLAEEVVPSVSARRRVKRLLSRGVFCGGGWVLIKDIRQSIAKSAVDKNRWHGWGFSVRATISQILVEVQWLVGFFEQMHGIT